jgi:anti-anti-sigma regulatory factor
MIHAAAILLASLFFLPFTYFIPMPAIAAILMVTVFSMADWKRLVHICKTAENAEIIILIVTFILTIFFNLITAISAGLILTAFLFLREMADSANVRPWTGAGSRAIPEGSAIYELNGPMFFAATDKLLEIDSSESGISVIILRASNMTLLDIEAIRNLEKMVEECKKNGVTVIVSHIKDQPLRAMQKVGLLEKIGEGNFVSNIDEAIHLAEKILEEERSCKEAAAEEERLRRAALAEEKKKRADELAAIKRKKAMERSAKAAKMIADNLTESKATDADDAGESKAIDADIAENANTAADSAEGAENAEKSKTGK